ncbi:MAG: PRC-barrel domain-containing protein [Desulfatitalea sp.]
MSAKVRGSRLYGAMVIALAEGQRLGRVSEVYIDKETKRIQGISFRAGIWAADQETYIGFEDVLKFNRDIVIVSGQGAGKALPKEMAPRALRALKGYKITTHAGKFIEALADVVIDREDGNIVEILLPENRVLQINIADVHFGPDLVMVPADYEPAVASAEPEPNDFVARMFDPSAISVSVRDGFEGVKTTVRNHINTETVKRTLKSGSQTARNTFLRTSQAIQQGIDMIMKKREAGKSAEKETDQPDTIDELAPESIADVETAEQSKRD